MNTSASPRYRPLLTGLLVVGGILAVWLYFYWPHRAEISFQPHLPDPALLARLPFQIQIHIAAALTALLLGTIQLIGVKGTTAHRIIGWTWVVAMATTAVSSLFIRGINPDGFSLIHLLSGWTIIALPMAVYAAKKHRVAAHRRGMTGLFVGGLLVAGLLTFLPGRLMWHLFLG